MTSAPKTQSLKPKTLIWLVAICLVVFGMVWLTLYQIRAIATDHGPTPDEIAQCRAALPPEQAESWTEHCETEPRIIWAARHPHRNALAVLALTLMVGYVTLHASFRYQSPREDVPRL